jgi:hypothetical protein
VFDAVSTPTGDSPTHDGPATATAPGGPEPEERSGGLRRAYVIIAHEQPNHLRRLCEALDAPGARCFVHFDASSGPCPPLPANAEAVPDPLRVSHGGFSQTLAVVKTLRLAFSHGFDVVLVLSGRDYPIKPDRELRAFLDEHAGLNCINFYPLVPGAGFYDHVSQRYFVDERMALPKGLQPIAVNLERAGRVLLPRRRFPLGRTPYRGSAYFVLTRQGASYVLDFLETPEGKQYLQFFRRTWGSDEMLFQSILLNSPIADTCRFYRRDRDRGLKIDNQAFLHYIDWDPARENPALLDDRDLTRILESEFFFARKFDEVRSRSLLDELDARR